MEILSDPTPDTLAMPRFDDGAIDMQELLCRLAEQVVNAVMDAEADQLCGGGANSSVLEGSRRLPSRTEDHLERRHSSPCHAAFLPGTRLSATTGVMILTACSAEVSSSSRPGVRRLNLVVVELRDYPKMRCLMLERTLLV